MKTALLSLLLLIVIFTTFTAAWSFTDNGNGTGTLSGTGQLPLNFTITSTARAVGVYTGQVTVNWTAYQVSNPTPRVVGVELRVVTDIHRTYLPLITR